jgi:hypothetical protein
MATLLTIRQIDPFRSIRRTRAFQNNKVSALKQKFRWSLNLLLAAIFLIIYTLLFLGGLFIKTSDKK